MVNEDLPAKIKFPAPESVIPLVSVSEPKREQLVGLKVKVFVDPVKSRFLPNLGISVAIVGDPAKADEITTLS